MPLRPRNRKKPRLRETTVTHNSVFAADRLKCRPRNAFGTGIFLSNSEPRTIRLCLKLWRGARGFRRVAVADRGKITRRSACASRVGQRALALANFFHLLFPQLSTINYQLSSGGIAQLVERQLCKLEVRGSNPLASKALQGVEATSTIGRTSGSLAGA